MTWWRMRWFSSILRKLSHFWRLPWRQKWLVLQAMVLLPFAWLGLTTLGLQRSVAICRRLLPSATAPAAASLDDARTITWLLGLATRHSVASANCLRRSLVLWFLLRRRRIPAEIRIGVRKELGQFQAHAWVEVAGT